MRGMEKSDPILLTRAQSREVDRIAIEEIGIPGVVLMENAGRNAALRILAFLHEHRRDGSVVILCGGGNNGGDGYVIARHLHNAGVAVCIEAFTPESSLKGDALINATAARRLRLPIHALSADTLPAAAARWASASLIVDALLGTGFTGGVRPEMAAVIEACNTVHRKGVPVIAIDLPSGLDADTGRPSNATIVADITLTFATGKIGFQEPCAAPFVGTIFVEDIGVPREVMERARDRINT